MVCVRFDFCHDNHLHYHHYHLLHIQLELDSVIRASIRKKAIQQVFTDPLPLSIQHKYDYGYLGESQIPSQFLSQ